MAGPTTKLYARETLDGWEPGKPPGIGLDAILADMATAAGSECDGCGSREGMSLVPYRRQDGSPAWAYRAVMRCEGCGREEEIQG